MVRVKYLIGKHLPQHSCSISTFSDIFPVMRGFRYPNPDFMLVEYSSDVNDDVKLHIFSQKRHISMSCVQTSFNKHNTSCEIPTSMFLRLAMHTETCKVCFKAYCELSPVRQISFSLLFVRTDLSIEEHVLRTFLWLDGAPDITHAFVLPTPFLRQELEPVVEQNFEEPNFCIFITATMLY